MNQYKLLTARDIYMPRLRQLRDELRKTEQDNSRKREALRKAEPHERGESAEAGDGCWREG